MDAPCNHVYGDDGWCLFCTWYVDQERNQYIRREQAKKHRYYDTYYGPSVDRHRGNYFGKFHSPVKALSDDALFRTSIIELACLLGVTRSPIDKERRRRRRKNAQ